MFIRSTVIGLFALAVACGGGPGTPAGNPPADDTPPAITAFGVSRTSLVPGEDVALSAAAEDPDGDPLAYEWSASCGGAASGAFANPAAASTAWTAAAASGAGTCTLALDVVANGKSDRRTANVTVSPPPADTPPAITAFSVPSSVLPGEALTVSATASDLDGDLITYAWSATCSAGAGGTFENASAASTTWTAAAASAAGTCTLALDVTANGKSVRRTASETVTSPPPADRPPAITSFSASPTSVGPGGAVTASATASDPDGDPLTYAWSATCGGTASGTFANASAASTTWTAAAASGAGTCTLALDVTANGQSVRRTASVTVTSSTTPTLVEALQTLAGRKTYFAHQSVGGQITGSTTANPPYGIVWLAKANGVPLVRAFGPSFNGPMLGESAVGTNYDPMSKIVDFETRLVPSYGSKAQYAMVKFCYTDFMVPYGSTPPTVASVFEAYRASLARLRAAYPAVRFVHVTVPLCPPTTDQVGGVRRHEYNERLRQEYEGREPLFDLARHEATAPDGTRVTFTRNGQVYDALAPAYLGSECHVNADGANRMAEALVRYLATLP